MNYEIRDWGRSWVKVKILWLSENHCHWELSILSGDLNRSKRGKWCSFGKKWFVLEYFHSKWKVFQVYIYISLYYLLVLISSSRLVPCFNARRVGVLVCFIATRSRFSAVFIRLRFPSFFFTFFRHHFRDLLSFLWFFSTGKTTV